MQLQLDALEVNSGFLKDARLEFSPGLTCIIGARGTCKSTIVESIRFVFNCDARKLAELCKYPTTSEQSSSNAGMIRATLGSGVAKCHLTAFSSDGHDDITIEREIDASPSVYRDGIEELAGSSVLHMVEIYSQGDLQKIAHDESLRLELIDRPNKREISELEIKRNKLSQQLKEVGEAIRDKNRSIEARQADVRGLDAIQQQLNELQSQRPQLSAELDQERTSAEKRRENLEAARNGVCEGVKLVRSVKEAIDSGAVDYSRLRDLIGSNNDDASQNLATLLGQVGQVKTAIADSISDLGAQALEDSLDELKQQYERDNKRYYELRREQEEVSDSLKKEDGLKKQIEHLSGLESELSGFVAERDAGIQTRVHLRTELQAVSERIHCLRQNEVERINEAHGEVVILTLDLGVTSEQYSTQLERLLSGSGIRNQDEIAKEVAAQFRPCDLIDIIEAADAERLSSTLDRDLRQMTRLVSHLMDSTELYALESILFDDSLQITLFDHGTPKAISDLSNGQMATALLPLILRPAPYPLIFDQPEDDLDNSFIYRTLVQQVQRLKLKRQLIFVTHNANIPVLGEADAVVVMEMASPVSAAPPEIGTVDEVKTSILSLLEGGSQAFRLRHERYKDLVQEPSKDDAASPFNN